MKHAGSWGQVWSPQVPSPPLWETSHRSPVVQSLWGAVEWRRGSAVQSCGVHVEAAPGAQRCEAAPQSWQPREGVAAVLEPGWAQGSFPAHSSHTPPDLHRCCFHQVCGELRCGRTHGRFCGQPFCAVTHWADGTKTNQQGKPTSPITQEFTETGLLCQMWHLRGFHWLCFKTFLLLRDLLLGMKAHRVLTSTWVDQGWSCDRQGWTDSVSTRAGTCQVLPFAARLGFVFSAEGKTTSRKKTQIFQSSCTLKYA